MSLKAVIFDVDGVIIDSKRANGEFYARLLHQAGYMDVSPEAIDACFHLPLIQSLERLTGRKDPEEIKRIWQLERDRGLYPKELLDYPKSLMPTLTELRKKYKLAIVTSRIKEGVQIMYEATGTDGLFDVVISFDDYTHPKPSPESLLIALQRLGIEPREAVYVGDSHVDVEAAQAAGIWSIHVAPKKHDDATVGITSFDGVLAAVRQIATKS